MFDPAAVRADFPILARTIHGQPLAYLDNAATTQKPVQVLAAMDEFYREHNANPHRGVHTLGDEATEAFEDARETVGDFIGAPSREVVFTHGTTESLNLLATGWGHANLQEGDAVLLSQMEHHAALVPWYMLAKKRGLELRFVGITDEGHLDLSDLQDKLPGAKALAVTHVSNVLGTVNPIRDLAQLVHGEGALLLVDGAQAVGRLPVRVGELDCDAYAFSGHKVYGPTGIGVLWARRHILESMQPLLGGGHMIRSVGLGEVEFAEPPMRFEAGTMPVAEAVGLAAAIEYLEGITVAAVQAHETTLAQALLKRLADEARVTVYGPPDSAGIVAFDVAGIHAHDLSTLLDQHGVEIRSGHHCAQPLHQRLGVPATARVSFGLYNAHADIDQFFVGLDRAMKTFAA